MSLSARQNLSVRQVRRTRLCKYSISCYHNNSERAVSHSGSIDDRRILVKSDVSGRTMALLKIRILISNCQLKYITDPTVCTCTLYR